MRRRAIFASATALAVAWCAVPMVASPTAVHAAATYTSGLYEMNEPAGSTVLVDSSGNGRNGAIGPNVQEGVVFGGATAHRFLNRSPNLLPVEPERLDTVPHTPLHNPDNQEYAVSVRYRTTKSFGNLIQKGQNGTTGGYFKIELPYGRPTCLFKGVQNGRTVQRAIEAPVGNELNDNQWHIVKCERLTNRIALWIDGVEIKRLVGSTGTIANDRNLSIAGKSNCDQVETTCDYFVGDIDWVRIEKGSGPSNPAPMASFTSNCTFLACSFNAGASTDNGSIVSYAWNFGDGTTGTGVAPNKTYSSGGTRTVTLTVTDNGGATNTTTRTVTTTANTPPVASFTHSCTFLSCTFTSTSTDVNGPIASHSWTIEGVAGTFTTSQVQQTFPGDESYTVALTVTDGQGATTTTSRDIAVAANAPPMAAFTSSCIDRTCTLDASSTTDPHTPITFSWEIEGVVEPLTGAVAEHTFATDGTFSVTLSATDVHGATSTATNGVVVEPNAAPIAGFTPDCDDLECTFTNTSTDPNGANVPLTYAWDFGDGSPVSTETNPTHMFGAPGPYTVGLTVTDFAAESNTATVPLNIVVTPNVDPTANFDVSCDDLECTFTSTSTDTDGTITTHAWSFGDGATSTEVNPVHTYAAAGGFDVELVVTDNDLATHSVTKPAQPTEPPNELPSAAFSFACDGLSCEFDGAESTDDGPLTYAWDFDGLGSATDAQPTFAFGAAGDYDVTLTVTDAAAAISSITHTVSVAEVIDAITFVDDTTTGGQLLTHAATVPASVQPGDGLLMFLSIGTTATAGTPAGVTGWTLVDTVSNGTGSTRLYSKVAGATDAGSQVRITLSTQSKAALTIVAYRGTSAAGPIATHTRSLITTSSASRTTPTATVTVPSWVVSYWAHRDSSSTAFTVPSTVTARSAGSQSGGGRVTVLAADSNAAVGAGPYGGLTATAGASSTWATAWTVVLAPA